MAIGPGCKCFADSVAFAAWILVRVLPCHTPTLRLPCVPARRFNHRLSEEFNGSYRIPVDVLGFWGLAPWGKCFGHRCCGPESIFKIRALVWGGGVSPQGGKGGFCGA